jgi:hypothetical protein
VMVVLQVEARQRMILHLLQESPCGKQ